MLLNNANITLKTEDGVLNAVCKFIFGEPVRRFEFSLSVDMTIINTEIDLGCIFEEKHLWQPRWGRQSRKYTAESDTPFSHLTIEYSGKPLGWCNTIEDELVALSSYSSWFPFGASLPLKYEVELTGMHDWYVINGRKSGSTWVYGDGWHDDCNIIALREGHYRKAGSGSFAFYYRLDGEKVLADIYADAFPKITDYYMSVFGQRDIAKLDIVSLGLPERNGAYYRKELIVISRCRIDTDDNINRLASTYLLAHEIGHNWFTSADVTTWEDWLNETGANWAALLYALDHGDNELFQYILRINTAGYENTPVIRPPDGMRPINGVHSRGTALFYAAYQKFGREEVLSAMQTLASLSEVTTDEYLNRLREKSPELAEFIESNLTAERYYDE